MHNQQTSWGMNEHAEGQHKGCPYTLPLGFPDDIAEQHS
jgi:hypothetical protein